jgi:hypothetical protein
MASTKMRFAIIPPTLPAGRGSPRTATTERRRRVLSELRERYPAISVCHGVAPGRLVRRDREPAHNRAASNARRIVPSDSARSTRGGGTPHQIASSTQPVTLDDDQVRLILSQLTRANSRETT